VKVSYSDGRIVTKYVKRSTKQKDSVSDVEKREDENNAKKWCTLYKKILEEMSLEEMIFEDIKIVEPEFNNIEYEIVTEKDQRERKQERYNNRESYTE